MSYRFERERFIARVAKEGLSLEMSRSLLRAATTLNRLAELSCSSEAADRDRIPCPASTKDRTGRPRKPTGICLCDCPRVISDEDQANSRPGAFDHQDIPRISLQEYQVQTRLQKRIPEGWKVSFQGDPRGYVLKVIPPSYAERNKDRPEYDLEGIGVPSGDSGIRW